VTVEAKDEGIIDFAMEFRTNKVTRQYRVDLVAEHLDGSKRVYTVSPSLIKKGGDRCREYEANGWTPA